MYRLMGSGALVYYMLPVRNTMHLFYCFFFMSNISISMLLSPFFCNLCFFFLFSFDIDGKLPH